MMPPVTAPDPTAALTCTRWTRYGQRVLGGLFLVGMVLFVLIIWVAL